MNERYIIQLIVVISSVLLGMFAYPWLRKKYTRFINKEYKHLNGEEPLRQENKAPVSKAKPSFVGESKTYTGHSRTKAATESENENRKENAPIFALESTDSDPEIKDIDVPLEREDTLTEEGTDTEEEYVDLETEEDAVLASGTSYDELMQTGEVIRKEEPTEAEKKTAGRILYEHRSTELVEKLVTKDEETLAKVNDLISFYMKKYNVETEESNIATDPEEFENFDINSIF